MASTISETSIIAANVNLKVVRGRAVTLPVVVKTPDDAAVNLTGGTLRFTVKWSPYDADGAAVFQLSSPSSGITITDATNGKASVNIVAGNTAQTQVPQHRADLVYSLQFTNSGSSPFEVLYGLFTILPNATITTP